MGSGECLTIFGNKPLIMKFRIIARKLFKYFLQGLIILAPITITISGRAFSYSAGLTVSCLILFTGFFPGLPWMKMVIPGEFQALDSYWSLVLF